MYFILKIINVLLLFLIFLFMHFFVKFEFINTFSLGAYHLFQCFHRFIFNYLLVIKDYVFQFTETLILFFWLFFHISLFLFFFDLCHGCLNFAYWFWNCDFCFLIRSIWSYWTLIENIFECLVRSCTRIGSFRSC